MDLCQDTVHAPQPAKEFRVSMCSVGFGPHSVGATGMWQQQLVLLREAQRQAAPCGFGAEHASFCLKELC